MKVGPLMDEVAAKAGAAPVLAAAGGASGVPGVRVTPPAATVTYPGRVAFDQVYQHRRDRITGMAVVIWIGRPDEPQTRDLLTQFEDGDGPNSMRQLLEGEAGDYTNCDTVSVLGIDNDIYELGGVPHLVAVVELDIYGPGEG